MGGIFSVSFMACIFDGEICSGILQVFLTDTGSLKNFFSPRNKNIHFTTPGFDKRILAKVLSNCCVVTIAPVNREYSKLV